MIAFVMKALMIYRYCQHSTVINQQVKLIYRIWYRLICNIIIWQNLLVRTEIGCVAIERKVAGDCLIDIPTFAWAGWDLPVAEPIHRG
jgi:hypothetical protein